MKKIKIRLACILIGLVLSVFIFTGCGSGSVGGQWAPPDNSDTTVPAVTAVVPAVDASDVAINMNIITVAFNEAMDPASLTAASFELECPAGTSVTGAVTYLAAGNVATLTLPPATDLPASTECTAMVTTEAKDLAGNALASNFVWTFTTGSAVDTTRPGVLLTAPETTTPGPTTVALIPASIIAVFTEDMAPLTIAGTGLTTFTVTGPGTTPVAGAVTYVVSSKTAVFTSAEFRAGTTYTATISAAATDLAGNQLDGNQGSAPSNYVWTFSLDAAAVPDTTRPTITNEAPIDNAPAVPVNTKTITAAFSEAMNSETLTSATFVLACPAGSPVTGTVVSYQAIDYVATLALPAATDLPSGTECAVMVSSGATDMAGNQLEGDPAQPGVANNFVWTFTTTAALDSTKPTVTAVVPANNAPTVAVNTKIITAAFNEAMNTGSLTPTSFTLACSPADHPEQARVLVTGTGVIYVTAGREATLALPAATDLPSNTACTATVTTAAMDVAGNLLAGDPAEPAVANNHVWTFNTGAAPDTARPTVTDESPVDGATDVPVNTKSIAITFSETMNPGSLTLTTFKLECPAGTPVTGTAVTYVTAGSVATLTLPATPDLPPSTICTAKVTTGARDIAGNLLEGNQGLPGEASNYAWTFRTVARSYTAWSDQGIGFTAPAGDAYYSSVLYNANGFENASTKYAMWYTDGTGAAFLVTSPNDSSWGAPTAMNGLGGDAHHVQVLFDANHFGLGPLGPKYKIWYWDIDAQLYDISAIATAQSVDGVNWVNDTALSQDASAQLVTGAGTGWNRGSYGPINLFYQPGAANSGGNPWNYSYVMYYDGTDGSHEEIGLAYSVDGVLWKAYSGNPVLPVSAGPAWDTGFTTYGTVYQDAIGYHFWYSGGVASPNDGIGYAFSTDGMTWAKNPSTIFHVSDGVSYRNKRVYTPSIIDDGTGVLKMYYSAQATVGSKKIGWAILLP